MANQCSEPVGTGAVNYLCRLPQGHVESEGSPHMAPEHGPSMIAHAKWERQQKAIKEDAAEEALIDSPTPPNPSPSTDVAELPESPWRSHDDRVALAMVSLTKQFSELPPAVASWVRGAQAQLALIEMWEATKDGPVVITRESLVDLIPEYLQVH